MKQSTLRVSRITFIRYAQNRKTGLLSTKYPITDLANTKCRKLDILVTKLPKPDIDIFCRKTHSSLFQIMTTYTIIGDVLGTFSTRGTEVPSNHKSQVHCHGMLLLWYCVLSHIFNLYLYVKWNVFLMFVDHIIITYSSILSNSSSFDTVNCDTVSI